MADSVPVRGALLEVEAALFMQKLAIRDGSCESGARLKFPFQRGSPEQLVARCIPERMQKVEHRMNEAPGHARRSGIFLKLLPK